MTEAEIDEIMNEHDVDHHHEITFEEFKDMILNHMWKMNTHKQKQLI